MNPYLVEKRAVEVRLALVDGSTLQGRLWMAFLSPNRLGPQTVADLAIEPGTVLPFRRTDGRFLLVGKASVSSITTQVEERKPEELVARIPASVVLAGGHSLKGYLLAERGAGERASDLLNTPDEWICIEETGSLHWLAKRHIVTVEPNEG